MDVPGDHPTKKYHPRLRGEVLALAYVPPGHGVHVHKQQSVALGHIQAVQLPELDVADSYMDSVSTAMLMGLAEVLGI